MTTIKPSTPQQAVSTDKTPNRKQESLSTVVTTATEVLNNSKPVQQRRNSAPSLLNKSTVQHKSPLSTKTPSSEDEIEDVFSDAPDSEPASEDVFFDVEEEDSDSASVDFPIAWFDTSSTSSSSEQTLKEVSNNSKSVQQRRSSTSNLFNNSKPMQPRRNSTSNLFNNSTLQNKSELFTKASSSEAQTMNAEGTKVAGDAASGSHRAEESTTADVNKHHSVWDSSDSESVDITDMPRDLSDGSSIASSDEQESVVSKPSKEGGPTPITDKHREVLIQAGQLTDKLVKKSAAMHDNKSIINRVLSQLRNLIETLYELIQEGVSGKKASDPKSVAYTFKKVYDLVDALPEDIPQEMLQAHFGFIETDQVDNMLKNLKPFLSGKETHQLNEKGETSFDKFSKFIKKACIENKPELSKSINTP